MARGHGPERTCIGCRRTFSKGEVVRLVMGPEGIVLDYRERLPGRAAYVCPRSECVEQAFTKERLSKAFRTGVRDHSAEAFLSSLEDAIRERILSLLAMARKAGMVVSGYSAVDDAARKGTVQLLLFADNVSAGTKEKIVRLEDVRGTRTETVSTKEELGAVLGRELAGVAAIVEKGFADAVEKEVVRLKGLLKQHR